MTLFSMANVAVNYKNMLLSLCTWIFQIICHLNFVEQPSVPVILKLKIDLSSVTCLIGSFDFRLKLSSILQEHVSNYV